MPKSAARLSRHKERNANCDTWIARSPLWPQPLLFDFGCFAPILCRSNSVAAPSKSGRCPTMSHASWKLSAPPAELSKALVSPNSVLLWLVVHGRPHSRRPLRISERSGTTSGRQGRRHDTVALGVRMVPIASPSLAELGKSPYSLRVNHLDMRRPQWSYLIHVRLCFRRARFVLLPHDGVPVLESLSILSRTAPPAPSRTPHTRVQTVDDAVKAREHPRSRVAADPSVRDSDVHPLACSIVSELRRECLHSTKRPVALRATRRPGSTTSAAHAASLPSAASATKASAEQIHSRPDPLCAIVVHGTSLSSWHCFHAIRSIIISKLR